MVFNFKSMVFILKNNKLSFIIKLERDKKGAMYMKSLKRSIVLLLVLGGVSYINTPISVFSEGVTEETEDSGYNGIPIETKDADVEVPVEETVAEPIVDVGPITIDSITVVKGGTTWLGFSEEWESYGYDATDYQWEMETATTASEILPSGVLNVGENETNSLLTITATLKSDSQLVFIFVVQVKEAPIYKVTVNNERITEFGKNIVIEIDGVFESDLSEVITFGEYLIKPGYNPLEEPIYSGGKLVVEGKKTQKNVGNLENTDKGIRITLYKEFVDTLKNGSYQFKVPAWAKGNITFFETTVIIDRKKDTTVPTGDYSDVMSSMIMLVGASLIMLGLSEKRNKNTKYSIKN